MTLSRETILDEVSKVKNGTIARIGYKTELPVKAEYKKRGVKIIKFVETSARLGVNYHHIASVIARKAEEQLEQAVQRANNYEWIIKDKVRHNTKTEKDYLYVASFNKGHNTKSVYILYPENGEPKTLTAEELTNSIYKHYVIDSYWKPTGYSSEVRNISFENIIRINKIGLSLDSIIV